jgi:error-prone DNA polymerase
MLIRGTVERVDGVVNLVAEHMAGLTMPVRSASRDFR